MASDNFPPTHLDDHLAAFTALRGVARHSSRADTGTAVAWAAEKARRLKLNGHVLSPRSRILGLEALVAAAEVQP